MKLNSTKEIIKEWDRLHGNEKLLVFSQDLYQKIAMAIDIGENSRILDVGCGKANIYDYLSEKIQYFGIDISPTAIKIQKLRNNKHPNRLFLIGDASKIPFESNYFDAVMCVGVLEHVPDSQAVCRELYRILKEGGRCVIVVPNKNRLVRRIIEVMRFIRMVGRMFKVSIFTLHPEQPIENEIAINRVKKMIKNSKFKIIKTEAHNPKKLVFQKGIIEIGYRMVRILLDIFPLLRNNLSWTFIIICQK